MIRTKISIAVFSLVTVLASTSMAGTEPNDANTPLTFEVSSIVLSAPHLRQVHRSPWNGMVAYAAGIPSNRSQYFPKHGSNEIREVVQLARSLGISKEQQRFLELTDGGLQGYRVGGVDFHTPPNFYTPPDDPNSPQFLLYAVSLEDAKKMAEAYVRYAKGSCRDKVVSMQDELKKLSDELADEQRKLPEVIQSVEAAKKSFEDLQRQVPYRDDKQALDAAAELDKMLNMAQVDIAGIRARIETIQGYQKSRDNAIPSRPLEFAPKLELMFIEEAVALQGAEARKRMATTLRKQADSYIDLKVAWQRTETERDRLTHYVSFLPNTIEAARQKLASEMEQEPKIINNKVFIYPVRPESPPSSIMPRTQP